MKKKLTKSEEAKIKRKADKKKVEKERKEALAELELEIRAKKKRIKRARKDAQKEVPEQRTPEQIEFSAKAINDIFGFLKDKFVYSKRGIKLFPRLNWTVKPPENEETFVPFEKNVFVKETEHIKEIYKPNNTYKNYRAERDPVPEQVIMNGFKDILDEYGITHLDDYLVRKLFYHIFLSIAHYLDVNPEFFLKLSDVDIYREPLVRNMFTVVIPEYSYKEKGKTIDSLYNYFVGGEMDLEALHKTLDVYALSYIEYTEDRRALRDKARDSYIRYRKMWEIADEAKAMLKAQGLTGKGVKKATLELREKLTKERAERWKKTRLPKLYEEEQRKLDQLSLDFDKKDLTNDEDHDIMKENRNSESKE